MPLAGRVPMTFRQQEFRVLLVRKSHAFRRVCAYSGTRMNVEVFGISDRATLERLEDVVLAAAWPEDPIHRWINVEDASPQELRELLAPLGLHPLILNACVASERCRRFISLESALYLEVSTHMGWDQQDKPYVSVLCLKSTIITIHRDDEHTMGDLIGELGASIPLYAKNSSALLLYLLTEIGRGSVDAALAVRTAAENMDRELHEQFESIDAQQIASLRRQISHLSNVHDDHTYCVGSLQAVESDALRVSEQSHFYHDLLRLEELAQHIVDGSEARVASLERDYELWMQKRADNRLQFLTVISALFLPMSLICSIYGMNFTDLPAMGQPLGYLVVLGFMLCSALITFGLLYLSGWFE